MKTSTKLSEKTFCLKVMERFERVNIDELKGPFYVCGMGVMKKLLRSNAALSN